MSFADTLKRAARFNPAWREARIYRPAHDEAGAAITDAEETFAYLDRTKDEEFSISVENYTGYSTVCVITENPPDDRSVILLDGVFYEASAVVSADVLQSTIRYACRAFEDTEFLPIRNNVL